MYTASRQRGFTLVEMMIVVAIMSVLAMLGAVSFTDFVRNSQRTAAVDFVRGVVAVARSEAIKRGRRVGVCRNTPGSDPYTNPLCDTSLSTNDWDAEPWLLFLDANRTLDATITGNCVSGATPTSDCIFRVLSPKELGGSRLVYNDGVASNYAFYVSSSGELGAYSGTSYQTATGVAFWFCDSREKGVENRLLSIGPGPAKVRVTPGTGSVQNSECVP